WSYSQKIDVNDIFFDSKRQEVVVTGSHQVSGVTKYLTVMFNASTGSTTGYYENSVNGSGKTIGQLGDGEIITGGSYTTTNACYQTSVKLTYQTTLLSPTNIVATDGLVDKIKISWVTTSPPSYYRVYRNTTNDPYTAQPINNWATDNSYTDTN